MGTRAFRIPRAGAVKDAEPPAAAVFRLRRTCGATWQSLGVEPAIRPHDDGPGLPARDGACPLGCMNASPRPGPIPLRWAGSPRRAVKERGSAGGTDKCVVGPGRGPLSAVMARAETARLPLIPRGAGWVKEINTSDGVNVSTKPGKRDIYRERKRERGRERRIEQRGARGHLDAVVVKRGAGGNEALDGAATEATWASYCPLPIAREAVWASHCPLPIAREAA